MAALAVQDETNTTGRDLYGSAVLVLMEIPSALRKCNMTLEQEEMLLDSLRTYQFQNPTLGLSIHDDGAIGVGDEVTGAVRDWAQHDWRSCGMHLGALLRELVLGFFPQKYSVDGAGKLRKQLLGASAVGSAGNLGDELKRSRVGAPAQLLAMALMAFMAAVSLRNWRCVAAKCCGSRQEPVSQHVFLDIEESDVDAITE